MLPENDPVDIQMGSKGAMARLASGKLYCWGSCGTTPDPTSLISQHPYAVAGVLTTISRWRIGKPVESKPMAMLFVGGGANGLNGNENLVGSYEHTNLGNITHLGTGHYVRWRTHRPSGQQ